MTQKPLRYQPQRWQAGMCMRKNEKKIERIKKSYNRKIIRLESEKETIEQEKELLYFQYSDMLKNYKSATEALKNIILKCSKSDSVQYRIIKRIIVPEINNFLAGDTRPEGVVQRITALGLKGIPHE